jgi:hypothetical protein
VRGCNHILQPLKAVGRFIANLFSNHKFMRRFMLAYSMVIVWLMVWSIFIVNTNRWESAPTEIVLGAFAHLTIAFHYYFKNRGQDG